MFAFLTIKIEIRFSVILFFFFFFFFEPYLSYDKIKISIVGDENHNNNNNNSRTPLARGIWKLGTLKQCLNRNRNVVLLRKKRQLHTM